MEPAGVSGSVTISDQRSYIKIETLRCKNPIELQDALSEVCGVFTVERNSISRWANRFRGVCVSIDDGCPNHATEGKRFSPPSTAVT